MYPALLNQSPPAPYQMQQPQQQQAAPMPSTATPAMQPQYNMPQSYAHGGRPKRGKMVLAHMSPKELNVLDHVQGKVERCPRSNLKSYSHLEELLKNPHILHKVHQHVQHHAHGGTAHALAANGVHGDTELAMIGPHTHQIFNQLSKMQGFTDHDLTNPHDGRPQYWSLGETLGGIWNGVKGGAQSAYETAKPLAQDAYDFGKNAVEGIQGFAKEHPGVVRAIGSAGQKILPALTAAGTQAAEKKWGPIGGLAAEGLGALGESGADYMSNFGLPEGSNPETDPYRGAGQLAAQGMKAGYDARKGGAGRGESIGAGINAALSRFTGPAAGAAQGFGQSLAQGQMAPRGLMGAAATGAFNGAGGKPGIRAAANNLMSRTAGGQGLGSALREMSHGSVIHGMPTPDSMNNQDASFAGGYG